MAEEKLEKRRFYSKVPGSRFIFPDGGEIFFNHGFHEFDPEAPEYKANPSMFKARVKEMDELVEKVNPLLFKQGIQPEVLPRVGADQNAKTEGERDAAAVAETQVKGRVAGELNTPNKVADPNSSTVDTNIAAAVLSEAGKAAKLRSEAAARAAAQVAANTTGGTASNG